jgi:hypothetical protein
MAKCKVCNRGITPLMIDIYTCRCDNIYCRMHLHDHGCTFDYHELWRKQTEKVMTKVVRQKIEIL